MTTPAFMDNVHWLTSFRAGDESAFKGVFDAFSRVLLYTAQRIVPDEEVARDMVAEAFNKLWQVRERMQEANHITGFLLQTLRNACLNEAEKNRRHAASHKELQHILSDSEEDFSRKLIEAELLQLVYTEAENLPPQCRDVFKAIYIEGMSTEEVAAKLGISTRHVLNQKQIALNKLRGRLSTILLIYCLMYIHDIYNK